MLLSRTNRIRQAGYNLTELCYQVSVVCLHGVLVISKAALLYRMSRSSLLWIWLRIGKEGEAKPISESHGGIP